MNQPAAVQSFQSLSQQDNDYKGDLLISFFDDVMVVQELNDIYIDMNEE